MICQPSFLIKRGTDSPLVELGRQVSVNTRRRFNLGRQQRISDC